MKKLCYFLSGALKRHGNNDNLVAVNPFCPVSGFKIFRTKKIPKLCGKTQISGLKLEIYMNLEYLAMEKAKKKKNPRLHVSCQSDIEANLDRFPLPKDGTV